MSVLKQKRFMENLTVYDSIEGFNRIFGIPTLHPLIHVSEMADAGSITIEGDYCFNFYTVYLKDDDSGYIKYGRNYYDYQSGTMLFMAPRQIIREDNDRNREPNKGWILMFHPDLLRGTHLGHDIRKYTFFQYDVNEALHLSEEEREVITGCFRNLRMELRHAADDNSKALIISNLELLLNYSKRFYERQFVTRSHANTDFLSRFERILEDYFASGKPLQEGVPSVKYFADKMNLSANYLTDMLRKHTGKSASEHIQLKLIDTAKERLLYHQGKTVNEIAYELGFEYPQYFCRLFKKRVGMTPNEYRSAN